LFAIVWRYRPQDAIANQPKAPEMSAFQTGKMFLIDHIGLAKDALHIYVGLIAFFAVIAWRGWRIGEAKPLMIAILVALAGEAWDLRDSVVLKFPINLWENWHDIWNTAFWPTAMTLLARMTKVFKN
jgi:hypothetical protein